MSFSDFVTLQTETGNLWKYKYELWEESVYKILLLLQNKKENITRDDASSSLSVLVSFLTQINILKGNYTLLILELL